jgi:hypothetical protein
MCRCVELMNETFAHFRKLRPIDLKQESCAHLRKVLRPTFKFRYIEECSEWHESQLKKMCTKCGKIFVII